MIKKISKYFCKQCGICLRGKPIPKKWQPMYGATHFGRELNNYDFWKDRCVSSQCPDCGYTWSFARRLK